MIHSVGAHIVCAPTECIFTIF